MVQVETCKDSSLDSSAEGHHLIRVHTHVRLLASQLLHQLLYSWDTGGPTYQNDLQYPQKLAHLRQKHQIWMYTQRQCIQPCKATMPADNACMFCIGNALWIDISAMPGCFLSAAPDEKMACMQQLTKGSDMQQSC